MACHSGRVTRNYDNARFSYESVHLINTGAFLLRGLCPKSFGCMLRGLRPRPGGDSFADESRCFLSLSPLALSSERTRGSENPASPVFFFIPCARRHCTPVSLIKIAFSFRRRFSFLSWYIHANSALFFSTNILSFITTNLALVRLDEGATRLIYAFNLLCKVPLLRE